MTPHQRKQALKRPKGQSAAADPDRPVFFYMPNEPPYGVFCQWYPTTFPVPTSSLDWLHTANPAFKPKGVPKPDPDPNPYKKEDIKLVNADTVTFNCAEQFMMYSKALFFHSATSASLIMETSDPKIQQDLGRAIPNYSDTLWLTVCERVAFEGNWWKFSGSANRDWREVLLGTRERELCEASKKDRRWGIGYRERDALKYRRNWGANLLGKALMRVRKELRVRIEQIEVDSTRTDWDLPE